jgi:hypothetical protein
MRRNTRVRLEAIAFACAVVLVVISAVPVFDRGSDASLIGLIAGSFGAGVMLTNLIRNARDARRGE